MCVRSSTGGLRTGFKKKSCETRNFKLQFRKDVRFPKAHTVSVEHAQQSPPFTGTGT